jgi:hypothetical protein
MSSDETLILCWEVTDIRRQCEVLEIRGPWGNEAIWSAVNNDDGR